MLYFGEGYLPEQAVPPHGIPLVHNLPGSEAPEAPKDQLSLSVHRQALQICFRVPTITGIHKEQQQYNGLVEHLQPEQQVILDLLSDGLNYRFVKPEHTILRVEVLLACHVPRAHLP